MADRVCVMSKGRIEQTATPAVLYRHPNTAFVAQFVGVSSRIPSRLSGSLVTIFGQECAVRASDRLAGDVDVDAILRPEDVVIDADPTGIGFVTHKSFLGATTRLVVQVGETLVRVDVRSDQGEDLELGQRVGVKVIARDVLVAPRVTDDQATQV